MMNYDFGAPNIDLFSNDNCNDYTFFTFHEINFFAIKFLQNITFSGYQHIQNVRALIQYTKIVRLDDENMINVQ